MINFFPIFAYVHFLSFLQTNNYLCSFKTAKHWAIVLDSSLSSAADISQSNDSNNSSDLLKNEKQFSYQKSRKMNETYFLMK